MVLFRAPAPKQSGLELLPRQDKGLETHIKTISSSLCKSTRYGAIISLVIIIAREKLRFYTTGRFCRFVKNKPNMKAVEFKSKLKNRSIKIPRNLSYELSEKKEVRVIVLYEEENDQDANDFQNLAQEQFFAGYSGSDSVYDEE